MAVIPETIPNIPAEDSADDSLGTELETIAILAAGGDLQRAGIFQRRMGWDGKGGETWSELNREFGLPRRQLRTVVDECLDHLRNERTFSPALDEAITVVNLSVPAPATSVHKKLVEFGLVRPDFDIQVLQSAGKALGKAPFWMLLRSASGDLLADAAAEEQFVAVDKSLARLLRHSAAAHISEVASDIALNAASAPTSEREIESIVWSRSDLQWLTEIPGWFWAPANWDNALLKNMGKVVATAPGCDTATLRQALVRARTGAAATPPEDVISALRRVAFPDRANVSVARPPEPAMFLSPDERALISVFRDLGDVLPKPELQSKWLELGRTPQQLNALLRRSPVVERLDRGIYALIGTDVSPGSVATLLKRRQRQKQIVDYGWLSDGRIWIDYRTTHSMLESNTLLLPAGMAQFLDGPFAFRLKGNPKLQRLYCESTRLHGWRALFPAASVAAGREFRLSFDLVERRLCVESPLKPTDFEPTRY